MFTVCFALYMSLTSTVPSDSHCEKVDAREVVNLAAMCAAADRDPLGTCEMRRTGALKYFMTVRTIGNEG